MHRVTRLACFSQPLYHLEIGTNNRRHVEDILHAEGRHLVLCTDLSVPHQAVQIHIDIMVPGHRVRDLQKDATSRNFLELIDTVNVASTVSRGASHSTTMNR